MNPRRVLAIVAACALAWMATSSSPMPSQAGDTLLADAAIEPDVQDLLFLGPTRPLLIRLHVTIDGQPFREVWQERFDDLFETEDRDGDGRLDLAGAGTVAREMNGGLADTPSSNLKEIVGEGTIDRQALLEYVERTFPRFMLRPRAVVGQGAALALFGLLDADHDNQLTAGELAHAAEQLRQRDFDDNGVITPGELILDPDAIAAAADPDAAEGDLDVEQTPVLAIEAGMSASHVAERLIKHYDHDGDGRLTADGPTVEIRLPALLLNGWDGNGDGSLEREELEQITLWNPDLELDFAFGQTEVRSRTARRRGRTGSEFRVRRKLRGGYDLDLGQAEIDFDRNNRDPRQADLVQFRTYDRDNNEYLDLKEAAANGIGQNAFQAMDVDGDKKVYKGELTSFMDRQNEAAAARLHMIIRDLGQDLFAGLDIDLDGMLSPRELRQARTVIDLEDKDGDGVLRHDEVTARLEFELLRGVDEQADSEARLIRRAVRSMTEAETAGPLWFRKMDRNNDGDLSPREFIGPREAFQRLDADGDGLLDRSEAEAADES